MQETASKPSASIHSAFLDLKEAVAVRRREPLAARKNRLQRLRTWILSNREQIHRAMYADFKKPPVEVDGIELFHVLAELRSALANLDRWASPVKVDAPLTMLGTRSFIQYEPRGVCLIISPWNYPFSLAVGPLVSALAAGNNVVLKPSEHTPHVSALIHTMAEAIFKPNEVVVVEGNAAVARELLEIPFDHIFFTGSPTVDKEIMRAAAAHLASVTLELGGKSPAIVTGHAALHESARRIAVAKFVNNGQTCVAPDYVLVDETIADAFVQHLVQQTYDLFAPEHSFEQSASYCRIVNERHFRRLKTLLQDTVEKGATPTMLGALDEATRFFPPVILQNVPADSPVLQEEIFGPILPVVTYKNLDDALHLINSKQKPLALYVFTGRETEWQKVLQETSSGGACINDCGIQFLHHKLPFGGVNNSGIGKSHGHAGFLTFSNEKPVLKQRRGFTTVTLFYPPYTRFSKKIMDWFLKLF